MASSQEIHIFQSATTAELDQATSLLRRGKGFATRGDPRMSAIVSVLSSEFGVEEYSVTRARAEAREAAEQKRLSELPGQQFLEEAGVPSGKLPYDVKKDQGSVLKQVPTGETYKGVPVTQLVKQDLYTGTTTLATAEEEKYFRTHQVKELRAKEETPMREKIIKSSLQATQTGDFGGFGEILSTERYKTDSSTKKLFIGAGLSVVGTTEFIGSAISQSPIKTAKDIGIGLASLPSQGPAIGKILREEPTLALGFVATEYLTYSSIKELSAARKVKQGVTFKGVSQGFKDNIIHTEVAFKQVQGGGKVGRAKSLSYVQDIGEGIYKVDTAGVGVAGTKAFKIPLAKPEMVSIKEFKGISTGYARGVKDNIFLQVSKGAVKQMGKSDIDKFVDVSVGAMGKERAIIAGATKFERGQSISLGMIKDISKTDKVFEIAGKIGDTKLVKSSLKSLALAQTQSIVKAGIQTPPLSQAIFKVPAASLLVPKIEAATIKPVHLESVMQPIKQPQITTLKLTQPTIQTKSLITKIKLTQQPKELQQQKIIQMQKLKVAQPQTQKLIQKQVSKSKLVPASISLLAQSQAQKVRLAGLFAQPVLRTPFSIFQFRTPVKPKPFKSFRLKPTRQKSIFGNFNVQMRRFGKWKSIGKTPTMESALKLGKFKTGTTLGRSFRVEGKGKQPVKIKGYRTKKTKRGQIFIEKGKFALNMPSELKEIQFAKLMKGGIK